MPVLGFSETKKCADVFVKIVGKYGAKGESSSPILEMWSLESGNLTSFEVRAKEAFTKSIFIFKDSENIILSKIEIPVSKNKSTDFDLAALIKKQTATTKTIEMQLYSGQALKEFCQEVITVIEVDGTGTREVKNAKETK